MGKRGDDARSALIETAERLFAERGVEAVSLRDVSAAAGQRNHSAAQYHFGDRAGLIAAVYEARMSVVNERRLGLLAQLDERGPCADLTALVEVFVAPLVGVVAETAGWYGRFVAQLRWDAFGADVLAGLPSAVSARDVLRPGGPVPASPAGLGASQPGGTAHHARLRHDRGLGVGPGSPAAPRALGRSVGRRARHHGCELARGACRFTSYLFSTRRPARLIGVNSC